MKTEITKTPLGKNLQLYNPIIATKLKSLTDAAVLQQIIYWLEKFKNDPKHIKDGKVWVYNSIKNWQTDNFPFLSISQIRRSLNRLIKEKLIIKSKYNKMSYDRTGWYTVDYDILNEIIPDVDYTGVTTNYTGVTTNYTGVTTNYTGAKTIPDTTIDQPHILKDQEVETAGADFEREKLNMESKKEVKVDTASLDTENNFDAVIRAFENGEELPKKKKLNVDTASVKTSSSKKKVSNTASSTARKENTKKCDTWASDFKQDVFDMFKEIYQGHFKTTYRSNEKLDKSKLMIINADLKTFMKEHGNKLGVKLAKEMNTEDNVVVLMEYFLYMLENDTWLNDPDKFLILTISADRVRTKHFKGFLEAHGLIDVDIVKNDDPESYENSINHTAMLLEKRNKEMAESKRKWKEKQKLNGVVPEEVKPVTPVKKVGNILNKSFEEIWGDDDEK